MPPGAVLVSNSTTQCHLALSTYQARFFLLKILGYTSVVYYYKTQTLLLWTSACGLQGNPRKNYQFINEFGLDSMLNVEDVWIFLTQRRVYLTVRWRGSFKYFTRTNSSVRHVLLLVPNVITSTIGQEKFEQLSRILQSLGKGFRTFLALSLKYKTQTLLPSTEGYYTKIEAINEWQSKNSGELSYRMDKTISEAKRNVF